MNAWISANRDDELVFNDGRLNKNRNLVLFASESDNVLTIILMILPKLIW